MWDQTVYCKSLRIVRQDITALQELRLRSCVQQERSRKRGLWLRLVNVRNVHQASFVMEQLDLLHLLETVSKAISVLVEPQSTIQLTP